MYCDLHTHSNFSDGTDTPKQIIDKALRMGLEAVALCDHDCVDGLPQFLSAAKGKNIKAVAGAEFSVEYKEKELHILALFIPTESFDIITRLMRNEIKRKDKRNRELITKLNEAGYDIDYDVIKSKSENGKFNRVAIANELMEKNYVSSTEEAYRTILSEKQGYYNPGKRIDFFDMIEIIKSIKAVPVLAHPFLQLSEEELEEFLPLAKEHGLAGMECYYSEFTPEQTECALRLCDKFSLKYSGGSDYHGENKPHIELGIGKGNLKIPASFAQELEKLSKD